MKLQISLLAGLVLLLSGCEKSSSTSTLDLPQAPAEVVEVVEISGEPVDSVVLVEYFDLGCASCKRAHDVVGNLKVAFGDRLQVQTRHFPLKPETFLAAEAAECARDQEQYEAYVNEVFSNFGVYTTEKLGSIAEAIDLDMEVFQRCLEYGAHKDRVLSDRKQGEKRGVNRTPYFFINDELPVPGLLPERLFKRTIQRILDGKGLEQRTL